MTERETKSLPKYKKATAAPAPGKPVVQIPYKYTTRMACPANDPAKTEEFSCIAALTICENAGRPGPLSRIYRREEEPGKPPTGWVVAGTTCYPSDVPNSDRRPQLTMAMIRSEWARTPFAKPTVSMQPVGNRTLVTLPTYFALGYPAVGFEPGEVRAVTMLGHQVRIKPTFKSNAFSFGDGAGSGATPSAGGVYPTGDITHAYKKAGSYSVSVSTTYGGQFSVDGGAFADIPGTTTITGPVATLQVVTTRNELVNE
ncbi:hypothetical protein [Calidifontibacter terrae]